MTDRFRYLPCTLHEALRLPPDVPWRDVHEWTPADEPGVFRVESRIDLAHPAGWDHAVRAYAAIRGIPVPESASVAAIVSDVHRYGADVVVSATGTPEERRRELCTRICAALGLDADTVFPEAP